MKRILQEVYKSCLSDLIALQPELFSKKADETENSSEKQTGDKPLETSAKSPPTTYKNIRIVDVTRQKGRGWVITGVRSPAQVRKERKRHSLDQSPASRSSDARAMSGKSGSSGKSGLIQRHKLGLVPSERASEIRSAKRRLHEKPERKSPKAPLSIVVLLRQQKFRQRKPDEN